ncbi:helix-turn-helix transcriptional regulator [Mesorhizobium sp. B1-1-8]|uniref:helix-turn-helix transcriptional regulator n=1 Tax=Mesorhizobium sp. B1-1-8 TaxID=2589976 RepID=UPI00112BC738|nr:helix-turn-helix domain-containing protein [Mesorhizobium sp. B1-1-8]UCI07336.1 helix-turn-helix domain-containing protein [Mesorhizobium sp. B1-1-8]
MKRIRCSLCELCAQANYYSFHDRHSGLKIKQKSQRFYRLKAKCMSSNLKTYVRTYRRLHALTQDELALLVGLKSGSSLSGLERNVKVPSASLLISLAYVFAVPVEDVFPAYYEQVIRGVENRAEALYEALQGHPGLNARTKLDLLEDIIGRAMSAKRTEI